MERWYIDKYTKTHTNAYRNTDTEIIHSSRIPQDGHTTINPPPSTHHSVYLFVCVLMCACVFLCVLLCACVYVFVSMHFSLAYFQHRKFSFCMYLLFFCIFIDSHRYFDSSQKYCNFHVFIICQVFYISAFLHHVSYWLYSFSFSSF